MSFSSQLLQIIESSFQLWQFISHFSHISLQLAGQRLFCSKALSSFVLSFCSFSGSSFQLPALPLFKFNCQLFQRRISTLLRFLQAMQSCFQASLHCSAMLFSFRIFQAVRLTFERCFHTSFSAGNAFSGFSSMRFDMLIVLHACSKRRDSKAKSIFRTCVLLLLALIYVLIYFIFLNWWDPVRVQTRPTHLWKLFDMTYVQKQTPAKLWNSHKMLVFRCRTLHLLKMLRR